MAVTLEMAMRECNNFFERCKYAGEIRIAGGKIVPDVGSPYVYISGSARNDGVHSLVSGAMEDADGEETFDGTLWFLYPPRPFIEIAKECAGIHLGIVRALQLFAGDWQQWRCDVASGICGQAATV